MEPAVDEAWGQVHQAEVKHTDGTSWLQSGVTLSLWTIATAMVTVFKIVANGSKQTLQPLYGALKGILVSDRAQAHLLGDGSAPGLLGSEHGKGGQARRGQVYAPRSSLAARGCAELSLASMLRLRSRRFSATSRASPLVEWLGTSGALSVGAIQRIPILPTQESPMSVMKFRSWSLVSRAMSVTALASLSALLGCSDDDSSSNDPQVAGALGAEQKAELDSWIDAALERYSIPGAAVAIVRGRDVIYEGAFGIRGVADPTPVTSSTRFALASVTKSMTSLMAATLVDEGRLSWDAPVVDLLPSFELADPSSTRNMRVRHLLNHSNGVSRKDTPLFIETAPPTEMIASLQSFPIVAPPGEVYIYLNQTVAAGGFLAALVDGARYEDDSIAQGYVSSMQQRVFDPIGMPRTTLDFDQVLADPDHAWPHGFDGVEGAIQPLPIDFERFTGTTPPASGAWSNVTDLAAYAATQLHGIAPDGARVVSQENLAETHAPAVAEGNGESYAMGWHVRDGYLGMKALWHDGDLLGSTSEVLLLPEADLAVVVLANRAAAQAFYGAVEQFAAETALSLEHTGDADQVAANEQLLGAVQALAAGTSPVSREQAQPYLGRYTHGAKVDFTDQGFVLSTQFGDMPLVSVGQPGQFATGGVITAARLTAAFDTEAEPAQVTIDMTFTEEPQPFVLERRSE